MKNKFIIIIPAYNVGSWITLSLELIKLQSYDNFECVIIDDNSTDDTNEKIQSSIKNDDRFHLLTNTENIGSSLANFIKGFDYMSPDDEDIIGFASEIAEGEDDLYVVVHKMAEWTKNNINYLSPQSLGQKDSDLSKRWTDDERLSWWWIKNNKSTNFTFIKVKNGDINPFLDLIKLHQIATSKLYLDNTFKDQVGIDIVKDNLKFYSKYHLFENLNNFSEHVEVKVVIVMPSLLIVCLESFSYLNY